MQKLSTFIAAICLLVFVAGISKMLQISDSVTYFSGFVGFSLMTYKAVSSRLEQGK
ncbi:MAG: hypothetical protein IT262_16650 [Saprospiraceae bacterium]|nr:hypothetical protein [Saprospiraceae bacterium]